MDEFDGRQIVTRHVFPPIPIRTSDWCAFFDGDEEVGLRGWGKTRAEAIDDLIAALRDEHRDYEAEAEAIAAAEADRRRWFAEND
jgi:hypothetical protein